MGLRGYIPHIYTLITHNNGVYQDHAEYLDEIPSASIWLQAKTLTLAYFPIIVLSPKPVRFFRKLNSLRQQKVARIAFQLASFPWV